MLRILGFEGECVPGMYSGRRAYVRCNGMDLRLTIAGLVELVRPVPVKGIESLNKRLRKEKILRSRVQIPHPALMFYRLGDSP